MTTPFWLWVSVGCAMCALFGFSVVRLGARRLGTETWYTEELAQRQLPSPRPVVLAVPVADLDVPTVPADVRPLPERAERTAKRPVRPAARRPAAAQTQAPAPEPAPTTARPDAHKLALWARQVKAGERKMSIATDGCRVTWNRTCKHGHPSWLVHLGYLKRHQLPRHNPR
jgi:hypothetical protein